MASDIILHHKRRLRTLDKRISRIEDILFDISTYKRKSEYIYLKDLWDAMEKEGLIRKVEIEPKKPYRQKIIDKRKKKQWM